MQKLICPECNTPLNLSIGYTGCDWDTKAGKGSGYGWQVSLSCDNCGRLFPIGYVKEYHDFSKLKDELKCVK